MSFNTENPVLADGAGALPETLVVSWHWPPAVRACSTVLANLFGGAPPKAFRVLTRAVEPGPGADRLPIPPLETRRVRWGGQQAAEGGAREWAASGAALARMIRTARRWHAERPFGCVLAVYPHRFGLLAGWRIARAVGVPLAVYLHDLFAEAYLTNSRLKRGFWREVDRRVLQATVLVAVPTREFAEHYAQRGVRRTLVLPHCVPSGVTEAPSDAPGARSEGDGLELLYAGLVYEAHADALAALLAAVENLEGVRLKLRTPDHPLLCGHRPRWVGRAEALADLRRADVGVVVLGRHTPYPQEVQGCFPSKLVDCLACGKPVLAVVPPGCFVERFLKETGAGLVVNSGKPEDVRAALRRLRDGDLRARMRAAAVAASHRLRPEVVVPRLLRGLAEVSGGVAGSRCLPDGRRPDETTEHEESIMMGASVGA